MIAVRQEVNLQTKAVRAQQEQNATTIGLLEESLEELRKARSSGQQQQSPDDLLRPLLKTLIDVHDALSLAAREAQRVQETVLSLLEGTAVPGVIGRETATRSGLARCWTSASGECGKAPSSRGKEPSASSSCSRHW
jgi:hypothetical protein